MLIQVVRPARYIYELFAYKPEKNCMSIYLEHIALGKHAEQKLLPILYSTYRSSKSLETTIAMPVDCLRATTEGRKMGIPPERAVRMGIRNERHSHFTTYTDISKFLTPPLVRQQSFLHNALLSKYLISNAIAHPNKLTVIN